jgi:hypothetical protein
MHEASQRGAQSESGNERGSGEGQHDKANGGSGGQAFLGCTLYTQKKQATSHTNPACLQGEVTVRAPTEVVGAELHSRPELSRVTPWHG